MALNLERSEQIKDALVHYRFVTQTSNINSLEHVLKQYILKVDAMTEHTITEMELEEICQLKDIEGEDDPQDLVLSTVSKEKKFAEFSIKNALLLKWETLKCVIEIVRNNRKLENMFLNASQQIFDFAVKYKRKNELKRLGENFRQHLYKIKKNIETYKDYTNQPNAIELDKGETNWKYFQIYLHQFQTTISLGLWQEAFKTAEDIRTILEIRKEKFTRMRQIAEFLEKLSIVFREAEYSLLHAYAYFSYFTLFKKHAGNQGQELLAQKTNKLFISLMSVTPFSLEYTQPEYIVSKFAALVSSSTKIPEKSDLMNTLKTNNYIEFASQEIKDLYALLEGEIHIMMIGKKAGSVLETLKKNPDFSKYVPSLEINLIYRALQHASKFYSRVKITTLYKYLSFASKANVNKVLLTSSLNKRISLKINHSLGVVIFNEDIEKNNDPVVKMMSFAKELKILINYLEEKFGSNVDDMEEDIDIQDFINEAEERVTSRKELVKNLKRYELDMSDNKKNVKIQSKKDLKKDYEELLKKEEEAQKYRERKLEEKELSNKFAVLKEILRVEYINFSSKENKL